MNHRVDYVSLLAGVAIAVAGVLLLLDQEGTVDLSLGLVAAILAAVVGVILVASGLTEGGDGG